MQAADGKKNPRNFVRTEKAPGRLHFKVVIDRSQGVPGTSW